MDINNKDISNRINRIMFDLGLNQNQLSKILNISQPAVSKYLQGRIPPPSILLQLSKYSGKTIEWFLTGETTIISKKSIVAENSVKYKVHKNLEEKIKSLPKDIQTNIEVLIDSILNI